MEPLSREPVIVGTREAELLGVARALVTPDAYPAVEATLTSPVAITELGPRAMASLGLPATLPQITDQRNLYDTKYAALYYPRVLVPDDLTGAARAIGPSGHICGIYARTDNTRGVHKAPANEVVSGVTGFEAVISRGQH